MGGRILPSSRTIILRQCGQCRRTGRRKGRLIPALPTRSKTISCKGQEATPRALAARGWGSDGLDGRKVVFALVTDEPRLAVRGMPKGALRTHSAQQAPLWGSLVTCVVYCLRVRQC